MSFFNNLQQYVSNSVANLNLSAKRFSLGRDGSSSEGSSKPSSPVHHATAAAASAGGSPYQQQQPQRTRTGSLGPMQQPTGPKAVPSLSAARTLSRGNLDPPQQQRRRSTLSPAPSTTLIVTNATASSAAVASSTLQQQQQWGQQPYSPRSASISRQPLPTLPCGPKKPPWPECEGSTSGAQEADFSFFESFAALPWKQENRHLQALGDQERLSDEMPPEEVTLGIRSNFDSKMSKKEREKLYTEVLYTITNKIGATAPGKYAHYKEDLYRYAQEAFGVSNEQHKRLLAIVSEEKAPIIVLNVVVVEAEGLEAKDPNGFSDPYCMLGIQPGSGLVHAPLSPSPSPSPSPSASPLTRDTPPGTPSPSASPSTSRSDIFGLDSTQLGAATSLDSPRDRLKKHHSFRLSFKRRDGDGRRTQRDSLSAAVPAKFIRATTVRPHTLSPRWNEKFRFDIDDVSTDILHLDIWDHDDESSVLECVSKLNEVRGVKGLGRYFKQIAQSARSGSQDDFLGCVNIPMQAIPSTGLEEWYALEGRSLRSSIQGRLRLKLWLSTREDRGVSEEEEDRWVEIRQHQQLLHLFIDHELTQFKGPSQQWSGKLPQVAMTILHQHAIQGDVTDIQLAMIRWAAFSSHSTQRLFDHRLLLRLLVKLEDKWPTESLTREEEDFLGEAFSFFIEHSLLRLRKHRQIYPPGIKTSIHQLENMLRCFNYISEMTAFRKCCPFHKEIRGEVCNAVRKGALEWYEENKMKFLQEAEATASSDLSSVQLCALARLVTTLVVDLQMALDCYDDLFDSTCKVPYFNIVFKQYYKTLQDDIAPRIEEVCQGMSAVSDVSVVDVGDTGTGTAVFELYLALQDFARFRDHLPPQDRRQVAVLPYHDWFSVAVSRWLTEAKLKASQRILKALEMEQVVTSELHCAVSTSALDATSCIFQIKEFWRHLEWPISADACSIIASIMDIICNAAAYFAEITHQRLQDDGFYDEQAFRLTDKTNAAINSLVHVRSCLARLPTDLQVERLLSHGGKVALDEARTYEFCSQIYETISIFDAKIDTVAAHLATQLHAPMKKNIFHLAWSPDSLPTGEALSPLLALLAGHLKEPSTTLLDSAFELVLDAIWKELLLLIRDQAYSDTGDKMLAFYERLYEALQLLVEFLHAEGQGLDMDRLQTPLFQEVSQMVILHKTSTDRLMDMYYLERMDDQLTTESTEFGILSVRAYLNHDSLCVEVLSARDLLPLDPNGLSDPFVIISILPRWLFPQCPEQQTAIQKKTLFPLFDECFEFSVRAEQCLSEGAMILFTVMDHDVLTANDFEGEAFLAMRNIPGVYAASSVDNLHGLKALDLPLMQQKNKVHPILQTLERRTYDKQAQDFFKQQKRRFSILP